MWKGAPRTPLGRSTNSYRDRCAVGPYWARPASGAHAFQRRETGERGPPQLTLAARAEKNARRGSRAPPLAGFRLGALSRASPPRHGQARACCAAAAGAWRRGPTRGKGTGTGTPVEGQGARGGGAAARERARAVGHSSRIWGGAKYLGQKRCRPPHPHPRLHDETATQTHHNENRKVEGKVVGIRHEHAVKLAGPDEGEGLVHQDHLGNDANGVDEDERRVPGGRSPVKRGQQVERGRRSGSCCPCGRTERCAVRQEAAR
jgi:hypothetical protein